MMRLPQNLIMLLKRFEYWRNEKLSRTELEAKQLRKFRGLVAFANRHSPYYADIIKTRSIDIQICEPEDFPILTKSDLMANFDRIVTDRRITKHAIADFLERSKDPTELFLNDIYVLHTSGSSGEVGMFVFSREDWARGMAQVGRQHPAPTPFKREKIASYTATGGHFGGVSWLNILRHGINKHFFEVLALEINSPLPRVIESLNAFQPDSLGGYVTGTKILAEKQREGILKIAPAKIVVGGEVLSDPDKAQLEEVFGCPVINIYGCTEHHAMGSSLASGPSIHLWEDDLIFELHDDHTIVTNLYNFTLPLIRYWMSDVLVRKAQKSSPWPYAEIEGVIGRLENTPKFTNRDGVEDFISPHTINEIFIPGVRRFQMQLLGNTSFRFMVCLDPSLDPRHRAEAVSGLQNRLNEILRQKMMDNVAFEIVVADELPVDPKTRKFRLILDAAKSDCANLAA
jgi:phenylacetate-CoA ligase